MTPKEKAEELVQLFIYRRTDYVEVEDAKKCALIAVDEIILSNPHSNYSTMDYWLQVKTEIKKL